MAEHNEFGKEAENRAAKYLESKNYRILRRNFHYLKAEIDIIAEDLNSNEIVIVEVKARKENALAEGIEAVTKSKRKLLVLAANEYLAQNDIEKETRFDIVSISKSVDNWSIEHIKSAFLSFE